jgi:poly-beta-1,6-N-acetyl-D-glucosamine N-deacetylase
MGGRSKLRAMACWTLVRSGLPRFIAETVQRGRLTILLYHDPSEQTMAAHLEVLTRTYHIVPLRRCIDAIRAGSLDDLPAKPLVITFDDGHRRNVELMDVLKTHRVPATIFVCSGIVGTPKRFWFNAVADPEPLKHVPDDERVERLRRLQVAEVTSATVPDAMDDDQVDALSSVVDFQSHTVSHPILTMCSDAKARQEVYQSRIDLERRYGARIYALAYPNGNYGEREASYARECGYLCAVTVDPGFNSAASDPFRLKRICINDDADGPDEVMLKACGLWALIRAIIIGGGRRSAS